MTSPWSEREIWQFLKVAINISETGKMTPTKIGVHACDINPYMHEFFEPILIKFFDDHGQKGKLGCF